jgi:micrococcal nuclease
VTKVIDGDTIKVRAGRRRYTVRIIGIDTPETRRPGVSVECGGLKSSASMKRLAPAGSRVLLKTDPSQATRDRYRRLLAYVRRNGKDLGRTQIDRGQANVYVYGGQPFARAAAYVRSLLAARAAGRGVWSGCGGDFHSGSHRSPSSASRAKGER